MLESLKNDIRYRWRRCEGDIADRLVVPCRQWKASIANAEEALNQCRPETEEEKECIATNTALLESLKHDSRYVWKCRGDVDDRMVSTCERWKRNIVDAEEKLNQCRTFSLTENFTNNVYTPQNWKNSKHQKNIRIVKDKDPLIPGITMEAENMNAWIEPFNKRDDSIEFNYGYLNFSPLKQIRYRMEQNFLEQEISKSSNFNRNCTRY